MIWIVLIYYTRLYRYYKVVYPSKTISAGYLRYLTSNCSRLPAPFPTTTSARSLTARIGARRVTVEIRGVVGARMVAVDVHTIVFSVGAG